MKKSIIAFLSILCSLFLFISCTTPELKINEPQISELASLPQADGYDLFSIGMLNDNTPIIILGTGKEDNLKKIYKVNIDGINKLIFEGEGRGSFYAIYIKSHPNNTYSIQFENE
ncbi:MAG TPA: hypothetical protein PKH29_12660, partial [Oscillospiraceae bacterium]|nr:hypothetical protein [Oscillospiraceae bacterium]